MDGLLSYLPDQGGFYYYVFAAVCVVAALYIHDAFKNMHTYRGYDTSKLINYGYDANNGPALWKDFFAEAGGQNQSPINLVTPCSIVVPSELNPLKFSDEFDQTPYEMKLYNNGLSVVLYVKWNGPRRPSICGGPLESDTYQFLNVRFRWGPNDDEGTEHMIDTKRYAIEMQAAFTKDEETVRCDLVEAARSGDLLMVSYLFMVGPMDNPFLEPIVQAMRFVKYPMSYAVVCPFPLKLLTPLFSKNYFSYEGSLTFPPCTEGVKWIVQPEPLLISARQAKRFRKLGACSCAPIVTNSRPVQLNNGREIFYYD